jgi:hypothetical protein
VNCYIVLCGPIHDSTMQQFNVSARDSPRHNNGHLFRQFWPEGAAPPELAEAKVEKFFRSLDEPQCRHLEFFQSVERTRISLSRSHCSQWN